MKAQKEWVDFNIEDLTFGDHIYFTKESFEERFKDKFEAVRLDEEGLPSTIWTTNYVIQIVNFRIMWLDTAWTIADRNPTY